MKNFQAPGMMVSVAAPSGGVASGAGVLIGANLFGVAASTAAQGDPLEIATEGIFEITKLTTDVVAVGDRLAWDNTNKRLTKTLTSNPVVAIAVEAAGNGITTVKAKLWPSTPAGT